MWGIDIKKRIEEAVMSTADDYKKEKGLSDVFLDPIIGYASAKDPLFFTFNDRNWTLHPKEIYRPGNTIIVHFLPFAPWVAESNRGGKTVSKEWTAAWDASIMFSAMINDAIKETLESLGRLASLANLPSDWCDEKDGPNWSHKLTAFAAGMGDFGIAGSFNTSAGSAGRFGSVITEYVIEPTGFCNESDGDLLNAIADKIEKSYQFKPYGETRIVEDKIHRCPAGAITSDGVDRSKCRAFCAAQKQIVPSADVCGKCFD